MLSIADPMRESVNVPQHVALEEPRRLGFGDALLFLTSSWYLRMQSYVSQPPKSLLFLMRRPQDFCLYTRS